MVFVVDLWKGNDRDLESDVRFICLFLINLIFFNCKCLFIKSPKCEHNVVDTLNENIECVIGDQRNPSSVLTELCVFL